MSQQKDVLTRFLNKEVMISTSPDAQALRAVVKGIIYECGDYPFYELEGGKRTFYLSVADVSWIEEYSVDIPFKTVE